MVVPRSILAIRDPRGVPSPGSLAEVRSFVLSGTWLPSRRVTWYVFAKSGRDPWFPFVRPKPLNSRRPLRASAFKEKCKVSVEKFYLSLLLPRLVLPWCEAAVWYVDAFTSLIHEQASRGASMDVYDIVLAIWPFGHETHGGSRLL